MLQSMGLQKSDLTKGTELKCIWGFLFQDNIYYEYMLCAQMCWISCLALEGIMQVRDSQTYLGSLENLLLSKQREAI